MELAMRHAVTLTRKDGKIVRAGLQIHNNPIPKKEDKIDVICDGRIVRALVTRVIVGPGTGDIEILAVEI
jgi:hypothetical protein